MARVGQYQGQLVPGQGLCQGGSVSWRVGAQEGLVHKEEGLPSQCHRGSVPQRVGAQGAFVSEESRCRGGSVLREGPCQGGSAPGAEADATPSPS